MKCELPERKTFSKEEIFSALDGILESGPLNLCGIAMEMPGIFNITYDMAWELFAEWAETVIGRHREIVDLDGSAGFKLMDSGGGGVKECATGTGAATYSG